MAQLFAGRKRIRKFFGKIREVAEMPNLIAPVYTCGYRDQLDAVDGDGCVPVPDGPGLGVTLDWDYISAHETDRRAFGA